MPNRSPLNDRGVAPCFIISGHEVRVPDWGPGFFVRTGAVTSAVAGPFAAGVTNLWLIPV